MEKAHVNYILDRRFRANPDYELIAFDKLNDDEKRNLGSLPDGNGELLYGIFKPKCPNGLTLKAATPDVALLFYSLREENFLPHYLRNSISGTFNDELVKLVLSGVIEVELNGEFISGSMSYSHLYQDKAPSSSDKKSYLSKLSDDALKYGELLNITDTKTLSAHLYNFNRVALSPRWQRLFLNKAAVEEFLGVNSYKILFDERTSNWMMRPKKSSDRWLFWRKLSKEKNHLRLKTYKLYLSPECQALENTFPLIYESVTKTNATSFKIGNDGYGLLRPDKIVIYFSDKQDMIKAGQSIKKIFKELPVHGVPFTSQLDENGLVSWGIDPPSFETQFSWDSLSWRLWVTDRLSKHLIEAKKNIKSSSREPWEIAKHNLSYEGINVDKWEPAEDLWD